MSQILKFLLFLVTVYCVLCSPIATEIDDDLDIIKINDKSQWPYFNQNNEDQRDKVEENLMDRAPTDGESDLPVEGDPLENGELFEGDLKIPFELYRKYYLNEENTDENKLEKRAAIRDVSYLWPSGIVYYYYHLSVDRPTGILIRQAMDYLEEKTCLRFLYSYDNSTVRIRFQRMLFDGCYSNFIGKMSNLYFPHFTQVINLGDRCNTRGIILHEIGHAVGFWHEQSRPDRDNYITINWNNIREGKAHNFYRRNSWDINHHGSDYDYGSIMHYSTRAFRDFNCTDDCTTIDVSNREEYSKQGEPLLGQRFEFSPRDIEQVNRMYSCPGTGIKGFLRVKIKDAINLPNTDSFGLPDPYVHITAIDSMGNKVTKYSHLILENTNATWNQWLDFGAREWQLFRIQVMDYDWSANSDRMTLSETIPINGGYHSSLQHCIEQDRCDGYLTYDYHTILDNNDCFPNPCENHGICYDRIFAFVCACPSGFTGLNCQYQKHDLWVYARYGLNLLNTDHGWYERQSDPYMKVTAYDHFGNAVTQTTFHVSDTVNPNWYQWLYFGAGAWTKMIVSVHDSDIEVDDALSGTSTYYLHQGSFHNKIKYCYSGYVFFDYHLGA